MSGKNTTDIDTQREYFNASYFNQSGITQIAKYEVSLLKPFFTDPDKWKLAINRFRVPLSGIPLTSHNIPFQKWQVGLGYNSGVQGEIDLEYVEQYNPAVGSFYNTNSITPLLLNQQIDSNLNPFTVEGNTALSSSTIDGDAGGYYVQPCSDSYVPATPTIYALSDNFTSINCYVGLTTSIPSANLVIPDFSLPNNHVSCLCADTSGNLFVAYTTIDGGGNVVPLVQAFVRSSANVWAVGGLYNTNGSVNYFNTYIEAMAVLDDILFCFCAVGGQPATSSISIGWNLGTLTPASGQQFGYTENVVISNGTYYFQTNSDGNLRITNSSAQVYLWPNVYADYFLGFDTLGNLLMVKDNVYTAFNYTLGNVAYAFSPPEGSVLITNSAPFNGPIDSGDYNIYTFQAFLTQINTAFQSAFVKIKASLGASYIPTEAPRIVYNGDTKFFSMIVEGTYSTLNSGGQQEFQIFMNEALWRMFFFPSIQTENGSVAYPIILVQNNGINAIEGNGSASLPQFLYVQQETSTIYQFNDLTRLIVGTISIPVSGDGEGTVFTNSGATANRSINMITDIIPDTSTTTNDSPIIYIPNGILRWYNLYAQQPFTKVDLIFYYETKDGLIQQLTINNGEYFSCKLEFKKGSGDF